MSLDRLQYLMAYFMYSELRHVCLAKSGTLHDVSQLILHPEAFLLWLSLLDNLILNL